MPLADKVLAGDVQSAARLISRIEDEAPDVQEEMNLVYPHTGRASIIGVTGPPGAGKSTLTDRLIQAFRKRNMTVGVVAVDPSSPFSGGAILGDRIRMQRHSTDKDVFIRSLATRGWMGGLAKAAIGAVHVMDAMGKDIIFIETVGSGQIELDITRASDTTILVLTPGSGDDIQMMKAGILEAADIIVINKADREGAENLKTALEVMLMMRSYREGGWRPRVIMTEAIHDKGTEELAGEIVRHREFLVASGELKKRQRERARFELLETVESLLNDFIHRIDEGDYLQRLVSDLLEGRTDPRTATLEIGSRFALECQAQSRKTPKTRAKPAKPAA